MKLTLALLIVPLLLKEIDPAIGQDAQPLREAQSDNGRFYVQIRPGRPGYDAVRGCKATLFERSPERQRARERWERFLVNDVAPVRVLIREDGRVVVTLDEYGRGGARHALAIYGERGELLRHFVLTDLLAREDWKHVKVQKRSIEWLDGARFDFRPDPDEFVITLKHGREIKIDLKRLRLMQGDARPAAAEPAADEIPREALATLLASEEDHDLVVTGPVISSSGRDTHEATSSGQPPKSASQPSVRETSAEGRPEPARAATPERVVTDAPNAATAETAAPAPLEMTPARRPGGREPKPVAIAVTTGLPAAPLEVPLPDPARPVDYLAWVNRQIETDGANAGPLYEEAISRFAAWDGDPGLLKSALNGDAEALGSPALQDWLDRNLVAITRLRDGTRLDFKGWKLHSEDGSMIGALLPNLAPMRQLAQAAVIDGKRLEAEGFAPGALDNYVDTLAAGAHVGRGPTLIENLVGIAIQTNATRALLDLPAGPAADRVDYGELAARLMASSRPTRSVAETLKTERAMFLDTLQRAYRVDAVTGAYTLNPQSADLLRMVSGGPEDSAADEKPAPRLSRADYERIVHEANGLYEAMEQAVSQPYPAAQRAAARLEAHVTARPDIDPLLRPFVKALVPSVSRTLLVRTRAESARQAATLVASIMAYRQQHGDYPESLAVFGGRDFSTDPFTGEPFAYRREGEHFVLYSLGANGVDDGGVHDEKAETADLVFWPRPK